MRSFFTFKYSRQPASFYFPILFIHLLPCPGGGIGRRSRLKICRSQECAGSIPVPGTDECLDALQIKYLWSIFIK